MRIVFGIAEFMVHAVHNAISPRNQVRGALEKPGAEIKETLPEFTGGIHLVGCVSV